MKVRLTEARLARIVESCVLEALQEKFDDPRIGQAAREHGGIKNQLHKDVEQEDGTTKRVYNKRYDRYGYIDPSPGTMSDFGEREIPFDRKRATWGGMADPEDVERDLKDSENPAWPVLNGPKPGNEYIWNHYIPFEDGTYGKLIPNEDGDPGYYPKLSYRRDKYLYNHWGEQVPDIYDDDHYKDARGDYYPYGPLDHRLNRNVVVNDSQAENGVRRGFRYLRDNRKKRNNGRK